jgi:hypothetical protein
MVFEEKIARKSLADCLQYRGKPNDQSKVAGKTGLYTGVFAVFVSIDMFS